MANSNKLDVLEFKHASCFVVKEEGHFCVVSLKALPFKKAPEFWEMNHDLVIFASSQLVFTTLLAPVRYKFTNIYMLNFCCSLEWGIKYIEQ